jgi:Tfp pilus assembly protein PilF
VVAYSAPPPPRPELQPAAGTLAAQAERQRQAGDYVGAAATLERALRIQPQEAYLWNRLAHVRLEQGRYAQAGNFAQRSNALAKDQPDLKRDNWGMIAVARRTAGDIAGATEAEAKARGG